MFTVVEDMNPKYPKSWQHAAKIVVCEIFDSVDKVLDHLSKNGSAENVRRIVSSVGVDEFDENLNMVLEGLHLLDVQFEGMLNNSKWFESDSMYWVEEWRIFAAVAAAAGIQNNSLFVHGGPDGNHPDFYKSASAGVFESWMLREQITETLIKKQKDYGSDNIARFGRGGLLVRAHDKVARLKNLHLFRSGEAANESIADTYTDIIGYSAIGMMWEREWFLLPMAENDHESD